MLADLTFTFGENITKDDLIKNAHDVFISNKFESTANIIALIEKEQELNG